MNTEDVVRMAREAEFEAGEIAHMGDNFIRFAALVAAHEREECAKFCRKMVEMAIEKEREECAKVCDAVAQRMDDEGEGPTGYIGWIDNCASKIRARGEK